jgi:hypothetical protein
MPLDLGKVSRQIGEMVSRLKTNRDERRQQMALAAATLHNHASRLDPLKKKIAQSKTTWLVAEPVEKLDVRHPLPSCPPDFTVIATDGSHIDVDRHHGVHCYLINIGSVVLTYGAHPDASLESRPVVYSDKADLVIASPDGFREVTIEGNLLGMKRSAEEARVLAELGHGIKEGGAALGLMDGTLIMWNLEAYPEFVTEAVLDKGYLSHLEDIRRLNATRKFPIAAYISYPRSTDVVNALRVALCPREAVDSDRCPECKTRECQAISGLLDRELFAGLLATGERSALFISPSRIQKRYGRQLVHFFYLHIDGEIARIEVPRWVIEDRLRLELVHSVLVDQCRRGQGYPVALSEAHEKAVVTGTDRDMFWRMVEEAMAEEHLPGVESEKSRSKRTRWI